MKLKPQNDTGLTDARPRALASAINCFTVILPSVSDSSALTRLKGLLPEDSIFADEDISQNLNLSEYRQAIIVGDISDRSFTVRALALLERGHHVFAAVTTIDFSDPDQIMTFTRLTQTGVTVTSLDALNRELAS